MSNLATLNQELSTNIELERSSRFSKFLANNISDFCIFSIEGMAIDLTAYVLDYCQKNIPDAYGFYKFDYSVFAKIFEYKEENLFRHYQLSDSIEFLKGTEVELSKIPYIVRRERETINLDEIFDKSQKGDKAFSTCLLGNMFYELRYKTFVPQDRKAIFKDKSGSIIELHGVEFNLIEQYHVVYSRNRRDKTVILFKPNSDLLFNNFKYFLFTDLNKFKDLPTNKKRLFIFICSSLNDLKLHSQSLLKLSVNEGCRISNINYTALKQNKKKLKMFLNDINDVLDDSDKFLIKEERITPDSNHKYLLTLEFTNLKAFDKKDIELINKVRYDDYYRKALYDNFVKYHLTLENGFAVKMTFEEWILDMSIDLEHKISAYIESQAVVYNKKLSRTDYEVLKEFTPTIALTAEEAKDKLLHDNRLKKYSKAYYVKTNNANVKVFSNNTLNTDKFLNQSIDMYLKAYPAFKEVAYAEDTDQFFVVVKDAKNEILKIR